MFSSIVCSSCKESFASKEHRSLHTCNSIIDRNVSEEGRERSTRRVQSLDENEMLKTLETEDDKVRIDDTV